MDIDLKNRVAVVTGASRGIGAAIASALASCGAHVVVNYRRNGDLADGVVSSIAAAGGKAEACPFDVADEAQVKQAFGDIAGRLGSIDILVNNAGVSKDALLLRAKSSDMDEMFNTNLKGSIFCSFQASRSMLKQKHGRIVTISSIVGMGGNPGQSVYAAAKAGLIGFTKSLAKELGPKGILVNAVAPGFVETDMTRGMDADALREMIPLRRIGTPAGVAGLVGFPCPDLNSQFQGQA